MRGNVFNISNKIPYLMSPLRDVLKSKLYNSFLSSRSQMIFKTGVLNNYAMFTGKKPMLESLFNKVAVLKPATLLKRVSNTGVFL